MSALRKHKFSKLYGMSSGISTKPEQAGHGAPFLSFSTVFFGHFLPPALPDQMDTSEKEQETYSIKAGDIFLTRTSETLDELGMSSVATSDYPNATYSGFLKRLRPTQSDQSYHKFMAFYLRSKTFRKAMDNNAVMTLRCSLNEQIFSYLELLLPDFDEQVKIGDFLYLIHQKIELNNQINAELEAMAKLLYDYWFVQFDFPMTAAQAASLGRPVLAGHPYKSSGGKMVHNPTLNRHIPDGWSAKAIESCSKLNELVWTDKTAPETLRYVDLANTKNGSILDVTDYSWRDAPSRARRKLRAGDTIIGTVRPGNRSFCLVPKTEIPLTGSTGFAVLTPRKDCYREFNYLSLTSTTNINRLTTLASGAAYPAVNPEVVASYEIAFPPESLIQRFHNTVKDKFDLMQVNQKQNQELTQLRDWLLPMLMNGQVTVGA